MPSKNGAPIVSRNGRKRGRKSPTPTTAPPEIDPDLVVWIGKTVLPSLCADCLAKFIALTDERARQLRDRQLYNLGVIDEKKKNIFVLEKITETLKEIEHALLLAESMEATTQSGTVGVGKATALPKDAVGPVRVP